MIVVFIYFFFVYRCVNALCVLVIDISIFFLLDSDVAFDCQPSALINFYRNCHLFFLVFVSFEVYVWSTSSKFMLSAA